MAEFDLKVPRIHVNLNYLRAEAKNKIPVEERGWQSAVRAVYPFKVNLLTIEDGDLVYIEEDPKRPLHFGEIALQVQNIRNVQSPEMTYPSPFSLDATVFETGRARIMGSANFLAEPHPGIEADLTVTKMALDHFRPVLSRYNIEMDKGLFSPTGKVEYALKAKTIHLNSLIADDLPLDYIHAAQTTAKEQERVEKIKEVAGEVSKMPDILLRVDDPPLTGQLGMVNIFFSDERQQAPPGWSQAAKPLQVAELQMSKPP